jgi:hypothetical protein
MRSVVWNLGLPSIHLCQSFVFRLMVSIHGVA